MKVTRMIVLCYFALMSTAFGGGGGSSSGGGAGSTVYTGMATATLNAPGIAPVTESGGLTVTVSGRTVTVSDGESSGSAPLSADGTGFIVPVSVTVIETGITCTVKFIFNGTISGNKASGPITGSGTCSGFGNSLPVTVSGSFNTTTGSAKAGAGRSLSNSVRDLLENF